MKTYSTGATTYAVHDLLLFVDRKEYLSNLKEQIYKDCLEKNDCKVQRFNDLLLKTVNLYIKDFPYIEDHRHVYYLNPIQEEEFKLLLVNGFISWRLSLLDNNLEYAEDKISKIFDKQ